MHMQKWTYNHDNKSLIILNICVIKMSSLTMGAITLVTICTLVWFLLGASPFMRGLVILIRKTLVTICTLVQLLSLGVNPFVFNLESEKNLSQCTLVRFLNGVNLFISGLVRSLGETLITIWYMGMVSPWCESFHALS